ncbi:MAG TPA: hypothetical protein DCY13_06420, partial [Verrucomicrobiales bacterium]|nr:hypothetical protein [Verrucomicrobiales bacterium]
AEQDVIAVELYLDNGQRAVLEVLPLVYSRGSGDAGCEMIVWCEMPGEMLADGTCKARWISRAPEPSCPWSHVSLPPALLQQIEEHLAGSNNSQLEGSAA